MDILKQKGYFYIVVLIAITEAMFPQLRIK